MCLSISPASSLWAGAGHCTRAATPSPGARAATQQLARGQTPQCWTGGEWWSVWRGGVEAVHAGLVRALLVLIALLSATLTVHAQPMTVDTSFVAAVSGGKGRVLTTAVQPDGKVLIGGDFRSVDGVARSGIARLLPNGLLDTSFTGVGVDPQGTVNGIALQSDGKVLVVGGFDTMHGQPRQNVVRLNTDGSLDASFGALNFFTDAFSPWFVSDVTVQSDGRILIAGQFYEVGDSAHPAGLARRSVARLNSNGSIDTTFNSPWSADDIHINSIALQPDGKILLTGYWASMPDGGALSRLVRLDPEGTLDRTFLARVDRTNFRNLIIVQPDGKIVMAGNFDTANGQPRGKVVRFNADGSLDLSFNAGTGPDAWGSSAIALQPDGKLIVGGAFDNFNGVARKNLVRLNMDGSVDTGFVVNADQSDSVNALATVPSGGFVAGGKFTMLGGVSTISVARVLPVQRTVTTSGERATISPSGAQRVAAGGSVSFTITPDSGYHINDAFGCPGSLSGNVYTVGPVTTDCTLWVKAVSDSLNARCGRAANQPTHSVPTESLCSGTGVSSTPSRVDNPLVGGSGRVWAWTCRPALVGDSTQCLAPYLPYLVTPSAGANGRMSPGSPQGAAVGYDVSFTVTPDAGYEIDTVTGCNGTLWGDRYTTQNVRADCTVRATFKALPPAVTGVCGSASGQAAITAPTANLCSTGSPGTVSGSGPWTWICTGAGGGTTAACSAPVTLFNVTSSVGTAGGGTVSPTGVKSVAAGQTARYTLTPDADYAIDAVGGTCGGGLVGNTYTTSAVSADCTVIANFATTVSGACGTANGLASMSPPAANLCSAGSSTAVTGSGPWAWSCKGAGSGADASCSAPVFTPVTHFEGLSATGTGRIVVDLSGGGRFCGFTGTPAMIAAAPGASPARPAGIVFPHGLFDFTASNCTPGSTITLTMQLPSALPATARYYKWGPEPTNAAPHWYQMPADIVGSTVTFSITDGAQGDDDLDSTNGTIVDQGGPGVPGEPVPGAAVTPVPTLGEWSVLLLGLLAAGLGARRLRGRAS